MLMVGTSKGAFFLRSDRDRVRWKMDGPHFPGEPVYALAYDGRNRRRRLFASGISHWGPRLRTSDDLGASWSDPERDVIRFPDGAGVKLEQIWQVTPGTAREPDTLYCGVAPAALFVSRDGGESWSLCQGLFDHPHRPKWMPGGGGLALHTILPHPREPGRMLVAISAAGVYLTDDGGASWRASNQGIRAELLPDKQPEFGQCVHRRPGHPGRRRRRDLHPPGRQRRVLHQGPLTRSLDRVTFFPCAPSPSKTRRPISTS